MKLKERPYNFNWSKNDIRYAAMVSDVTLPNITGQVKIMYAPAVGGSFTELITLSDLKPDATGYIYVYIQDYLNSLLEYVVPDMSNRVTPATAQAARFYIEYREVTDDDTDPDWKTTESAHACYVLKGGIEKLKHSYNNYFINYFNSNKPFLTWMPGKRFVYSDQLAFIAFLNNTAGTSVGMKLKFSFVDVAGGTYTYTYTFTQNDIVFHLNVSPTQSGFPTFTAALQYYDVVVTSSSDVALTETYRIYVEYRPVYEFWDLFWHNSLGGFDGSRVVGETTISIATSFTENGAGKDVTAIVNKKRDAYLLHTAISKRNNFKGDIGWQKNKEENEALQEILLNKSIYQVMNDLWLPVLNLQQTQDLRTSKSRMFSFPIQWTLASEEEVFTPKDRSFSVGVIPVICDPVVFDTNLFPNGVVGEVYSAGAGLNGDAPFTITSVVHMPAGLTAEIIGDEIVISGTPTTAGDAQQIQVVVANCASATFTRTIDIAAEDGGGGGDGTHFGMTDFVSGDEWNDFEDVEIIGDADEAIIVTCTNYVNGNAGSLTFNGVAVTHIGQTFSLTLDGSGLSDAIHVNITGNPAGPTPSSIIGRFVITTASGGSIGTPDTFETSKIFS